MKMWIWNKIPAAALTILGVSMAMAGYVGPARAESATNAAPTGIIAPSPVDLPPVPAKVLQMSEAGVSDGLIVAYVQKSANSYSLTAEQIIYLHDLGVSSAVLKALVGHAVTGAGAQAVAASGSADTQDASAAVSVAGSTPPVSGAAADFYTALAPYGSWVDVPSYGWCWQPTVVVVNPVWQPYCNNGYWLWTDQGWYWSSYYSWGWAPFHYGRWFQSAGYGWLWCPDNAWGPAWVCWRDYPGYCGWAPLPPGAYFTAGVGWIFNGLAVGFNYGFGLGPGCFTFCDYDDFCNRHPFDHFRRGHYARHFFNHSRVDNDFALDAHHRFFNHGINPARIEAVTHKRIGQVVVRRLPRGADHSGYSAMPDRLARQGSVRVIYRPNEDLSVMRNRFRHGTLTFGHRGGQNAAHRFTAERTFGNAQRFQPARPDNRQPSASGLASNHNGANSFDHNQYRGTVQNSLANHFLPAQNIHHQFSDSRHVTPARSFPSHFHPAPSRQPQPAWHSAPARHPANPGGRSVRVFHPAPAAHAAPAFHPAPAFHSAPASSRPARSSGNVHFNGGGAHFGGGRRR